MKNKSSARSATAAPLFESLESRTLFSAAPALLGADAADSSALVASLAKSKPKIHLAPTSTKLSFKSGLIGQAITFNVTVRCAKSLGDPTGTVLLRDHNVAFQTLTLTPNANPNAGVSTASFTIAAGAGAKTYSFGQHRIVAQFQGNSKLHYSHDHAPLIIHFPHLTRLVDKVRIGTVIPGTGPGITAGQTASLFYTGWLYKKSTIFDNSLADGGTPLSFTIDANPLAVIPGFNEGVKGMKVGETRVIIIPSSLAYGKTGSSPSIPPNSKLIFILTLQGIS